MGSTTWPMTKGWVAVGESADTSEFAVNTIARWWETLGSFRFPQARRLLITADAGGSNGYRVRAWKWHYNVSLITLAWRSRCVIIRWVLLSRTVSSTGFSVLLL